MVDRQRFLKKKTGKGSVTINFADDNDLNRILDLIE